MQLIFDWSDSFYEEKASWRGDEDVISLEISQKECGFAFAKLSISAKNTNKLIGKTYAKIGVKLESDSPKVDLLFSGRLITFPIGFGNSSLELELIAEPDDYQNQLTKFSQEKFSKYKSIDKHILEDQKILFDDLFFSANDVSNPTVFLEGSNEIFYWNMRSGKLSLSHINHGAKNINIIGNEVLQDSIKVQVSREPYKQINVKLSASWIQHAFGIIDIYPMIAAKFSANLVNSFTNIKTGIENLCKTSGKSGYTLIRCNMKEINPNATGILNSYPLISPDCYLQEDESSLKKKVNFKRFYFNGELIFSWNYKQKRMETVNVKVINKKSKYGREKNLFLRLNAVQIPKNLPIWNHFTYYGHSETVLHNGNIFECQGAHVSKKEFEEGKWKLIKKIPDALGDDSCGSFFATDRGKNAIRYALQKAIALMNYSSRYVAIEFCVEAKNFIFATINDQITIHDARFQKNLIVGKIIKTQLIANTTQKIMKITIGCCVDDFGESYFEKLKTQKIEILSDDSKINPADIVTNIDIKNSPEEQVICLSQAIAKNVSELKNILKKQATKIKISLHPLNTTRVITREINLPDLDL